MRSNFAKLLKQLRKNFPKADLDIVRDAYRYANRAHHGQMRLSGEPYVMHVIKVAQILANLGLDPVTCSAGLLHDVLEDTPISKEQLAGEFGEEIASLVDGVTKISSLNYPPDRARKSSEAAKPELDQAQNIRKMLVATAKDIRVILIKLADRLHNMRTIEFLPKDKQQRISRETLEIHAPLAHRLGISQWKWELEDHAFHRLMPEEYRQVAAHVSVKRREREAELNEVIKLLELRLAEAEVPARVIGRPKHLYSIYLKMVQQGKDFSEIMDIQGIRVIAQTDTACYNALGVLHSIWTPVPGRLKDYIAMPKLNMYQSIHTVVMCENGQPLEIQLRTENMDRVAREGIAAHWVYKEGAQSRSDRKLDDRLAWLRQTYEWLKDSPSTEDLMESVRNDFRESDIYVFTPKGAVKELPLGATPLDFAYLIHSDIGNHCMGARVNGRLVPLRYQLQTGDVVEILTSKNQTPHLGWIDIVATGRARTKIRQGLREVGVLEALEEVKAKTPRPAQRVEPPPPRPVSTVRQVDDATRHKLILIEGKKGMAVQFAKCCNPMPGQDIMGYVTKSPGGVTVHAMTCKSFAKSYRDPQRIIEALWAGEGIFEAKMQVVAGARPNVLADLTGAMRPMNIDIISASYGPQADGKSLFEFVFHVADVKTVELTARALRAVSGVAHVRQLEVVERATRRLAETG
jgi:GTP pyrophosphokinase